MKTQSLFVYCYHCRTSHPREDMRLIVSKTGKRWRCKQSIEAAKSDRKQREAFGRHVSEANKAESRKSAQRLANSALSSGNTTG